MANKFCPRRHRTKARHSADGCYMPGCTCTNVMKPKNKQTKTGFKRAW